MSIIEQPHRTDVAVVGAGLAGLAAARVVQALGHDVMVIDPSEPGGRGRTDLRGEVRFNRGPHALYLGGDAERVLRGFGLSLHGAPPSADGRGVLGEHIGTLPGTASQLARTTLLSWRGKAAVARLMMRLPRVDPSTLASTSFAQWLDALDLPTDSRNLVEMLARVSSYTNAPDAVSAELVVSMMQSAMRHGVRYLDGGWQTLVDALGNGVRIHRATVTSVRRDGAHAVVERADGTAVVARSVIVAAGGPETTARLLGRSPFTVGPAAEARCLDLATSVAARPGLLLGVDTPLYLSNHCPPARLAPDGVSVVHVARYLSPGNDDTPKDARDELAAHAARAGITAEHILDQRYLHRMTTVSAVAIAEHGGLRGRPTIDDSGETGVFLAGDWVGPRGHLLDAVMASAEAAARRAAQFVDAATLVPR
jgi:phytoene dehydrogenase-like protein